MNHNDNLVQQAVHASDIRATAAGVPLCEQQKTVIMNTVYDIIELALKDELQGIYTSLESISFFIKAGKEKIDETSHTQSLQAIESAHTRLLDVMKQVGRYGKADDGVMKPDSYKLNPEAYLTEEKEKGKLLLDAAIPHTVTFKVDHVPIRVGQDMRVEYEDKEEGRTLIVVISHEGIIMDLWDSNHSYSKPTATSSITFNEQIEEML
jgi:hypothetical protein